jgi:hypothetical protein
MSSPYIRIAEKLSAFYDKEQAWDILQSSLIPDDRLAMTEYLSQGSNLSIFLKQAGDTSDPLVAFYTLQMLNVLYSQEKKFQNELTMSRLQQPEFENLFAKAICLPDITKSLKIGFVLVFNIVKKLEISQCKSTNKNDSRELEDEERGLFDQVVSSPVLKSLMNQYFSKVAEISHENDPVLEWIAYLFNHFVHLFHAHSTIELFIRLLDEESIEHFFNFLHVSIDETIKSKSVHSLILDLKADLLDKDEDFAQRLEPADNKFLIYLKKADVVFLLSYFNELADSSTTIDLKVKRLMLINDVLRALVCISFLGAYNSPLQKLIINRGVDEQHFGFLGRLSDLLVALTKSGYKGNGVPKVHELNTNIIRMACNLIHANLSAQDFILDQGYLPFYLSQTNRDEYNMHAKEATVVFVRYMTEGNLRAREMIKALKVEDFILENASFVKKFDDL